MRGFIFFFLLLAALIITPVHAGTVVVDGIPAAKQSADVSSATPAAFVVDIYNFALLIGGILAFGGIVYGAAKYSLAAGNPSGQSDAKDQMTQAVLGLFLLFGAYYILKTINPDITALGIPNLATLKETPNTNQAVCGGESWGACSANGLVCSRVPYPTGPFTCIFKQVKPGFGCTKPGSTTEIKCSNKPQADDCSDIRPCGSGCAPYMQCSH